MNRTAIVVLICTGIVAFASLLVPPTRADDPAGGGAPGGCPGCHRAAAPAWHDRDVTDPGRGAAARRAHVRAADERGGCGGCHRDGFPVHCAGCHQVTERWVDVHP